MKRKNWFIIVAIVLVIVLFFVRHFRGDVSDTVNYRGEKFKMRKAYLTYEDYKDDPNNLDTNELGRIEKVMVEARFPSTFVNRKEFVKELFNLRFPGYGVGGIGEQSQTDDSSTLEVYSVEIPQRDKERYLVLREYAGHLVLLDDFVNSTATNQISQVQLRSASLFYSDDKGMVVREKKVSTR